VTLTGQENCLLQSLASASHLTTDKNSDKELGGNCEGVSTSPCVEVRLHAVSTGDGSECSEHPVPTGQETGRDPERVCSVCRIEISLSAPLRYPVPNTGIPTELPGLFNTLVFNLGYAYPKNEAQEPLGP
jgi:hypothetical protein